MQLDKHRFPGKHQTQAHPFDCQREKCDLSLQITYLYCSRVLLYCFTPLHPKLCIALSDVRLSWSCLAMKTNSIKLSTHCSWALGPHHWHVLGACFIFTFYLANFVFWLSKDKKSLVKAKQDNRRDEFSCIFLFWSIDKYSSYNSNYFVRYVMIVRTIWEETFVWSHMWKCVTVKLFHHSSVKLRFLRTCPATAVQSAWVQPHCSTCMYV